ncbi:MAG TPA: zinc ribbon domain-containing protein, partial [Thermofilaceae archaeon]|nr:zinc ribbon domain-containing protein [Thermofilaceae archaeon]
MSERFCFKCGRRLSVGVLYCSHCGYPASLYLTASPPLLRLTYKLSLTILVSGFLLAALADIVIPHLFPKLPMIVVDLLVQLSDT